MSLYITRHGQTDYNLENLVCGISEAKLTDLGIAQAKQLAQEIKTIKFDYLYVSPLQRAIDTANYLCIAQPLIIEERLKEINFGIFEGIKRSDEAFNVNKYELAYRYPKGESFIELCQRVYNFLDEIANQWQSNNVLLVCHGAVCRAVHTYFNNMTNEEIFHYQTDNCQLLKYEIGQSESMK